ncbi:MAG: TFIIB-type zinc ribbon-containing protein [Candidatus Woesearchaeota archaeon]
MKSIKELKECPDCSSGDVIYDAKREQLICRSCGLIFEPLLPEVEKKFRESHKILEPKKSAKKTKRKGKKKQQKRRV